ncbi:MAG: carboxypeptidase-like regulatory domain-containing protein [Lewinellaceae bacterium]|nr:carboxypeptidase-like regulatory domain-containing protein [Lewinellaceae bacterium]
MLTQVRLVVPNFGSSAFGVQRSGGSRMRPKTENQKPKTSRGLPIEHPLRAFIIAFFLLLSAFPVFSQITGAKITIQRSKIRVEEVLKEITLQSGIQFSYNPESIPTQQEISFHVRKASLEETLGELASIIPVDYTIIEDQIVLNRREGPVGMVQEEPEYFTVSGFVNSLSSGESLIGATAFARGTPIGTTTNAFGFYSLRLPKGNYTMEYSYLGFTTEIAKIELIKDVKKDMGLRAVPLELPDVIVETPVSDMLDKRQMGRLELKPADLDNMPEFGGESGLIRGLQAFPGIKSHSDGSAFFFVRGGGKDQNMVIIDDAPIYNPAHLFGFYSMVIPDFTKDIKIYKSDIPVNLGGRLSSIIDVRTKDGNLNKMEFRGAFNPLLYQFSLEGPVVKGKSSFFTSFRRSNFEWLYKKNVPNLNLNFGDFSFKWNFRADNKNRFFFTLINGRDDLANTGSLSSDRAGVFWNNFATTIRWNHLFSPKIFSNTTLYAGNYQYKLSSTEDIWHSGIGNLSLKSDFTVYNSQNITTKFGGELQAFAFNPGKVLTGSLSSLFPAIRQDYSRQAALYYSTDLSFSRWQFSAGARLSGWANLGPAEYYTFDENHEVEDTITAGEEVYQSYWNIAPRSSLEFHIDSGSSLKLSYGVYYQYIHLISNSASPFTSFEVWLPSSPNIKPQRAHQAALGYVRYFPKQGLGFSSEVYYKKMNNQIDYPPHAQTLLNPLIEGELRFGEMRSYGLELLLKKAPGRLNGWIAYTYSRALRQTKAVNGGREYPAFQDRPHDFSLMLNYRLTKRILFSAYWTAYTGSAFSAPTRFYTFNHNTVPVYDEKNNARLPDYNRLDVALKFILNRKPENTYQHSLTFSLYNALGHKNIVAVNFNKILDDNGSPIVRANAIGEQGLVATQADLVRFFPSLTYKLKISKP